MIKKLQKIGNSRGIVLEKPLLQLLNVDDKDHVQLELREDGILIKKLSIQSAYNVISQRHRKSLDKLGE